ncbi:MAG: IS200/IS605 family element transposase accessory protein TnpB, partial [Hormoscilla sp. SP12CHS1]|nr:IS200/IS605 family element transposase accessory protein TnpB [Hormoscilla sp. SP12CHS1]
AGCGESRKSGSEWEGWEVIPSSTPNTTSRRVIDWCVNHNIKTLIIGKNDGWKNGIQIGRQNNQQFVNIPHAKLVSQLAYKGILVGIEVITTEESYTSKASFLHLDESPLHGDGQKPKFSGR